MFDIGSFELILILVLGLIILGPEQLKQLAKYIGGALSKIKKLSNEIQSDISDELKDNDLSKSYDAIKVDMENIAEDIKDIDVDIDMDDIKLSDDLKSNKK